MTHQANRNIFFGKRKNRFTEFPVKEKKWTILTLIIFFLLGLNISRSSGGWGVLGYLVLWGLSYPVIYWGTCRYCAYYGKKCPVPLEGSCVHLFFEQKKDGFGYMQIFWASVAYFLRIVIPVYLIMSHVLIFQGMLFFSAFIAYWVFHLSITGCSNCINVTCPFNPDCK